MNRFVKKKRRKRRTPLKHWPTEIAKGNTDSFYKSTEWDIIREEALFRDKHQCQFYLGAWSDGKHFPNKIKPEKATVVHHIIPIKERPDLCLNLDNLVSLSYEAHEIIEERHRFEFRKKEPVTEEWW